MENPDWHHRIVQRTGASVCVGAAAGVFYSLVKNEPALSTATRTAGSFGIIGATFFSLSELCRVLRQADGPENSVWAGAGTGALLRSLHHGRAFALPGAIGGSILALVSTGAASLWTHGIPVCVHFYATHAPRLC
jgi:uncharacterized YccA/Bax inhibitor family protein